MVGSLGNNFFRPRTTTSTRSLAWPGSVKKKWPRTLVNSTSEILEALSSRPQPRSAWPFAAPRFGLASLKLTQSLNVSRKEATLYGVPGESLEESPRH